MLLKATRDSAADTGTAAQCARYGGRPFDLDDPSAYARWREERLAGQPTSPADLIVEMARPEAPTVAERQALAARLAACNMVVYAGPERPEMSRDSLRALGLTLGLRSLDTNMLSDDDGITPLSVAAGGTRGGYIPYTNRPLAWHTDGYYNAPDRQVRGLILHCVRPARSGGENALMDFEAAYIALRDQDPAHIKALMRPDAMTIPGNAAEGADAKAGPRPDRGGPVFRVMDDGRLHMRYTRRQRNVVWAEDDAVAAARAALEALLDSDSPYILRHRMTAGQGLISANVLHTRTRFEDGEADEGDPQAGRLMYRARYHDPVNWTLETQR